MNSKFSMGLFPHIPMNTRDRYQRLYLTTLRLSNSDVAQLRIWYCKYYTCSVDLKFLEVFSLRIDTLEVCGSICQNGTTQLFVKLPNTSCTCNSSSFLSARYGIVFGWVSSVWKKCVPFVHKRAANWRFSGRFRQHFHSIRRQFSQNCTQFDDSPLFLYLIFRNIEQSQFPSAVEILRIKFITFTSIIFRNNANVLHFCGLKFQ